jgi:hypothetical protein
MLVATLAVVGTHAAAVQEGDRKPAATVDGTWTGLIAGTPHGDLTMTMTLEQDGNKVTGTLTTEVTGRLSLSGDLTDGTLTLSTAPDAEPSFTMSGSLKEDGKLSGSLSTHMGDMTWSAERVKDKP